MQRLHLYFFILTLLVLSSCKTQEDIRREKTVDSLNEQVAQTQKSTANTNGRFTTIEEQMAKMNGQLEELAHSKQLETADQTNFKDKITSLEEVQKKQSELIQSLNDKVLEQSKYLEQVVKTLATLSEEKEQQATKKKEVKDEKEIIPTVKAAIAKMTVGKVAEAKEDFLVILDSKKSKKKDREAALHYLGIIELKLKNLEDAKVYFSKLFTENPNSFYAPSALFNLAKTFIEQKSTEEAKQSLDELQSRFPKSREAKLAGKLKAKL